MVCCFSVHVLLQITHPSPPDPTPPTPNPAPTWDRPPSFSPPSGSLSTPKAAPSSQPQALHPHRLCSFPAPDPRRRPCDTVGTLCGLLSLFSPNNKGRVPRRQKGRDQGRGHLPSPCPAAVQHPGLLLSRGEGGLAARAPGMPPRPAVQALENGVSRHGCWLMVPAEM